MIEAWKVGITLSMVSNHKEVLGALASGLGLVDKKVAGLTEKFSKLKFAVAGALGAFVSEKMLSGLVSIVREAEDLSHILAQIKKTGTDIGGVQGMAEGVTGNLRGIKMEDVLKVYLKSAGVLGGKEHAMEITPALSAWARANANTTGDMDASLKGAQDIVRAAEQMGQLTDAWSGNVDLEKFKKFLDLTAKISAVTGGQVTGSTWRQIATTGGASVMGMDEKSLGTLAILSQYMGGSRTGTAMMSLQQQMAGGTMFKRTAEAMEEIGLLKEGEWKTSGGRVVLTPEARERLSALFRNPTEATAQVLEALEKHGYDTPEKQNAEIFAIFGRATTQRAMADLLRNRGQIDRELGMFGKAEGVAGQNKITDAEDMKQVLSNLSTAWHNFVLAISGPQSQVFINVLQTMTGAVEQATKFATAHPMAMEAIAAGIAALGVAFAGATMAALLAAIGVGGTLTVGILGLAAGVGTLIALNWNSLVGLINSFADSLSNLWSTIKGFISGGGRSPSDPLGLDGGITPSAYHPGGSSGLFGSGNAGSGITSPSGFRSGGGYTLGNTTIPTGNYNAGAGHAGAGDPRGMTSVIRAAAEKYGIDPNILMRVARSEGLSQFLGDHGTSFGALQLHRGGRGSVGTEFERATGLNLADPHNEAAAINFGAHWAAQHGWGAWSGARKQGLHGFEGIHRNQREIHLHNTLHLDGKVVARNTMKHIVRAGNAPGQGARLSDTMGTRALSV
jgi:hypothetical protein